MLCVCHRACYNFVIIVDIEDMYVVYGFLRSLVDDYLMTSLVSPRLAKNIGNLAPSLLVFEAGVGGKRFAS